MASFKKERAKLSGEKGKFEILSSYDLYMNDIANKHPED